MNFILRTISFVFHPLIMPLVGVMFYFSKAPRFIPPAIIKAKLLAMIILTIALPILVFFLLKSKRKVSTIYMGSVAERIIPLIIYIIILYVIMIRIFPSNELIEPYFFIVGVMGSTIACLVLAILKFKASIHMMAVSGVLMFFIGLAIHFHINIIGSIALMFLISGAVATSRMHLKAHLPVELLIGFIIGIIPQLIVMNYWL